MSLPCLNYLISSLSNTNLSLKNVEIPSKYDDCSSINIGKDDFWIYPTTEFKELDLSRFDRADFQIRTDLFFIDVKKQ
jgi:hypothetical protein